MFELASCPPDRRYVIAIALLGQDEPQKPDRKFGVGVGSSEHELSPRDALMRAKSASSRLAVP